LLEDDGLILFIGIAAGLVALTISLAVILFGYAFVKGMISSVL
jgi:hypothetical protein